MISSSEAVKLKLALLSSHPSDASRRHSRRSGFKCLTPSTRKSEPGSVLVIGGPGFTGEGATVRRLRDGERLPEAFPDPSITEKLMFAHRRCRYCHPPDPRLCVLVCGPSRLGCASEF